MLILAPINESDSTLYVHGKYTAKLQKPYRKRKEKNTKVKN